MAEPDRRDSTIARALGMWPVALAVLIWLTAVGWPMFALMPALVQSVGNSETASYFAGDSPSPRTLNQLMAISLAWGVVVAAVSACIGWLPGRLLGGLLAGLNRRGFVPAAAFAIVPICLPAYVIFYAWWQSWPAGTALHRWVIEQHAMQWARNGTLLLGLVCWSWPLVALCVAGAAARRPRSRDEMLALDGASRGQWLRDQVRTDAPGLVTGMLLVFLATLNNTTCFDLAEVFTFANELRARAALGATPAQVLDAAVPMIAIAAAGGLAVWCRLGRRSPNVALPAAGAPRLSSGASLVIWVVSVALPLTLFWRGVAATGAVAEALSEFTSLYASNTLATLGSALISGIAAALATFGLAMMWHSDRLGIRLAAHAMSLSWIVWSLLPGTILGLALHSAWNQGALAGVIFRNPIILNLAHLAGAGFVAVLLARWCVAGEPRALHDVRRIDGAQGALGLWRSTRPSMLGASYASGVIVAVLAAGEIAVTAQVVPAMPVERTPLAMTLLNDMHYQRPQTVLVASILLSGLAIVAAVIIALVWRTNAALRQRSTIVTMIALAMTTALAAGCSRGGGGAGEPEPLDVEYSFGTPGMALGQFGYPRCIDVDPHRQCVYVIDKTARVQRFDYDGKAQLEWHMPEMQQGKPTGVTVGPPPDSHVYVLDTHYFRVIEYDADGKEINRFGEYGQGPGQFIYVTDLAVGPEGNLYVSEYGGNDRIQVFSPQGKYLFEFGTFGRGPGEFSRPQSLAFSRDGQELFITDACNHRIVVTDPQGRWLRTLGTAGREPGNLAYPYGLEVLDDGTLLVAEFGNNRIHRFNAAGRDLGVFGSVGRGAGQLQYPWAVAASDDRIFVLDSGNNRVQVIDEF